MAFHVRGHVRLRRRIRVSLGSVFTTSGINGIGGSTPKGILTYDRSFPIVATFFDPGAPGTPAITDFVSLRIDQLGDSGLSVTLEAFDLDGVLVDSFSIDDISGSTLEVSAPGIHSVRFLGTNDIGGAGVDDFTFSAVVPVPEPTSATLLALGLALLALGGRMGRPLCRLLLLTQPGLELRGPEAGAARRHE